MIGSSRPRAVLLDLLMATMDSMSTWAEAAGDRELGLRWRDAVTRRMVDAGTYRPYEDLVAEAARELDLAPGAPARLWAAWGRMRPWPDVASLGAVAVPIGFVTNCSTALARIAAARSGLRASLVLSAEEAGLYKPRQEIYLEACRRHDVAASDALFIAGAAYDAEGAVAAGLPACLVLRRPRPDGLDPRIRTIAALSEIASGI